MRTKAACDELYKILRGSSRFPIRFCLFVVAVLFTSVLSQAQKQSCTPSFPLETGKPLGWQGGDVGASIHLPDGRDVWIFGDTLYGPKRIVNGTEPQMVHSSLGVATCKNGQWHVDYVVKRGKENEPKSYFEPTDKKSWYWAIDGFYANGDLWVALLCIRHPLKPVDPAFDFETCGADLAQVSNLKQSPQSWSVKIHPLVTDGVKAYPSATTFVHDGYAYLFALYEAGTRPLIVTRIPLSKLDEPAKSLEYLDKDKSWKPGLHPESAYQVMERGAPELSIRYHPEVKKWIAVMVNPEGFSDQVLLREAQSFTGPWSEPHVVYHIPEMQPGPSRSKNVFCYAGKEHLELATHGDIVFTYVCNTFVPAELTDHLNIYYPKPVRVAIPAETN